jgi:hypothetical protein
MFVADDAVKLDTNRRLIGFGFVFITPGVNRQHSGGQDSHL